MNTLEYRGLKYLVYHVESNRCIVGELTCAFLFDDGLACHANNGVDCTRKLYLDDTPKNYPHWVAQQLEGAPP